MYLSHLSLVKIRGKVAPPRPRRTAGRLLRWISGFWSHASTGGLPHHHHVVRRERKLQPSALEQLGERLPRRFGSTDTASLRATDVCFCEDHLQIRLRREYL